MKLIKKAITNFISPTQKVDFYDSLQDIIISKKDYCNSILTSLINLSNCLNDFHIRINNLTLNLQNIEIFQDELHIHNLIESLHKGILEKFEESSKTLNEINSHFLKYIDNLTEEMQIYKEFRSVYEKLEQQKEKLKKSEDIYHKTGKEMEYKIRQFVQNNIGCLEQIKQNEYLMEELEQIIYPPNLAHQSYEKNWNITNDLIGIYNQKQCKFFNFLPEIVAKDDVFYFSLVNALVNSLENENKKTKDEINRLKDSKNLEKKENKNTLKILVEEYEKNKIEEKKKIFQHYPTELKFSNCKNKKEFEIYFYSIDMIKKYLDNSIYPNYDYDTEFKNFKINDLTKQLFANNNEEIPKNLQEDFSFLIEDPSVYHTFFVILSKFRAKGSFALTKSLITLLGDSFEKVLSKSKKNKLYDNVKNCIILSQTYYYEDDRKQKIYIFEFIKNNKWLKSAKFWRNFILYMIEKDLERFNNDKEKDLKKLGEVVFSQLLTFSSNMKSFEIDKRIIVKIIDEFIEKYNYISESNLKLIYGVIIQGKEGEPNDDLEKLRKEYDVSLEKDNDLKKSENNNDNEGDKEKDININKNNNDKEEEIKEDKTNENDNNEEKDDKKEINGFEVINFNEENK